MIEKHVMQNHQAGVSRQRLRLFRSCGLSAAPLGVRMELRIPCKHCKTPMDVNIEVRNGLIGSLGIVSVSCPSCGAWGTEECTIKDVLRFREKPDKQIKEKIMILILQAAASARPEEP